ncbi:MAG: nucleotidyltransferase substrate binding protein [Deltaproteobacteria bacterium]|nr:nucleotidyltransferase substrate binding protein [Deltaproteobacteria bacterium]
MGIWEGRYFINCRPSGDNMRYKQLLDEIRAIILRHAKPERIYLYGSRVNGEAAETSDIDIAYYDKEFKQNYLIEEEIQKLSTLVKIDVKNIAFTEERFLNRVISTGKVLYSANKKQRFEDGLHNFRKAFEKFAKVVDGKDEYYNQGFGDIYLDLAVKRFEFTYEMSWKAVKRYLDYTGIGCTGPRACFKEAFTQGVIEQEDIWIDMIEQRNLSNHVYDEDEIKEILGKIVDYKKAFESLLARLEERFKSER